MNIIGILLAVLIIHVFAAMIFIGGSLFIWFIVWPASYKATSDESERTKIVGVIGRYFGWWTDATVAILLVTGAYLGYEYVGGNLSLLTTTLGGQILLIKVIIVWITIVLMYANNIYHGKLIMRLAEEKKYDEMKRIRKITHTASFITLGLLLVIMGLAVALQFFMPA
ncbi:CopD family protein [Thermoplasma sp.]|uniref:CopD family protein n=1 Tax=Thermoplasma sp. TaxID=1973142 RepID=UPI002634256B|nr:CopD family protein [Thermoplasma sp.]